jgi:hypothetical protein
MLVVTVVRGSLTNPAPAPTRNTTLKTEAAATPAQALA